MSEESSIAKKLRLKTERGLLEPTPVNMTILANVIVELADEVAALKKRSIPVLGRQVRPEVMIEDDPNFTCEKCGGHFFGRTGNTYYCHDEHQIACNHSQTTSGIVSAQVSVTPQPTKPQIRQQDWADTMADEWLDASDAIHDIVSLTECRITLANLLRRVQAEGREACARLVENCGIPYGDARLAAAVIRNRK